MGKLDLLLLFLFRFAIISPTHGAAITSLPLSQNNLSSQCPMDLNYVLRIPWNKSSCQNYQPSKNNTANLQNDTTNKDPCCTNLLHLFGVGLAQHLKKTSLFQLPSLNTSVSCLQDYQTKLSSLSFPDDIVSHCFDPMEFVLTPNICAHVQTAKDWVAKLGNSTVLDSDCRPDLVDLTSCSACVAAGFKVQSDLILIDGNKSHATDCFYFTVLYAAGIVNEFGPESDGAVTCIFGLDLESNTDSSNKGHSALVFGLTGAGVAILVMSSLLGLYFWYDEKRRKKNNSSFPFDSEEQGSRPRLRPNTGSTWFKIHDLEKATENFSQKNFIGRGGFGLVYKGILSDGTTVAVKRIIESDIQGSPRAFLITDWVWSLMKAGKVEDALDVSLLRDGEFSNSNPRAIMERFVLVGILCAHVMVALRPTISDALKMLEGDIEVPPVPDRPMPLSHPSSFGDGFTISPALSFPQLNSGDMLRVLHGDSQDTRRDVEKLIVDMEQIREEINKNVEESNRNAVECKQAIEGLATTVEGLAAAVGKLLEARVKQWIL
ncbi:hypothetical protein GH714_004948 [Hevea brasiliensis]|uniref:SPARK domain-containing protein n=1 Tax=Hevea brasiliensis TaxID=3981 RepID=A0A6A6L0C7_HEVBR|nr:hypothetical protein GH714_004948 [Hevea brasiliensis]